MKNKIVLLKINVQDGENRYQKYEVFHTTVENEANDIKDHLKNYFGKNVKSERDGDWYYYFAGCLAMRLESSMTINKTEERQFAYFMNMYSLQPSPIDYLQSAVEIAKTALYNMYNGLECGSLIDINASTDECVNNSKM